MLAIFVIGVILVDVSPDRGKRSTIVIDALPRLNITRRCFFRLWRIIFTILLSLPATLFATALPGNDVSEKTDVYFAGIAFTGDQRSATEAFPYTDQIIHSDEGMVAINAAILAGFKRSPPETLNIRIEDLATLDGSTSALALAASIDRETVVVEKVGSRYKILAEISANALFFDFREKMVLASRPLTFQRIDITDSPPDKAQIREVVRHLLAAATDDAFVSNFVNTVRTTRIPQVASRRLQVTTVELDEVSLAALAGPGRSKDMLQQTLANELTKIIGDRERISLLPYQKGQAIGGAMSARFADGKVYMLTIPKPDYAITVKVGPVKTKQVQQTAVAINTLYGAYFNIAVTEPLSGKSYFNRDLRQGSTRVTPVTQTDIDHSAAHYENLLIGFDAFTDAISDRRSKWIKSQPEGKALSKEFKQLSDLVRTCR